MMINGSFPSPSDDPPPADESDSCRRAGSRVVRADSAADPGFAIPLRWLREHLGRAADELNVDASGVTVVIVGDKQMSELHAQHRGVRSTTDVLTFDLAETADPQRPEGEIYICADEAQRRAVEFKHRPREELLLYALHGLLHLLDFDDQNEEDYQRMHHMEDQLLQRIGIGAIFARPGAGGSKL